MSGKLLLVLVILFAVLQGGGIALSTGGGSDSHSLEGVDESNPGIGDLSDSLRELFDTSVDLDTDLVDWSREWSGSSDLDLAPTVPHQLTVNPSDRAVRLLGIRNDSDEVTILVTWRSQASPTAAWWDVAGKALPEQRFKMRPEAEQTLAILKGGGQLIFATEGDHAATIEFTEDDS